MTIFIRLLDLPEKASALQEIAQSLLKKYRERVYFVDFLVFSRIPGAPFAYWVSEEVRGLFSRLAPFESGDRMARAGLQSSDDFRFLRAKWETLEQSNKWTPFAKVARTSPFYADLYMKVNWGVEGEEIKAWAGSLYDGSHWSRIIKNTDLYFRPGMFQTLRASKLAPHITPKGCIFSDNGTQAFSELGNILPIIAILNQIAPIYFISCCLEDLGMHSTGTVLWHACQCPMRTMTPTMRTAPPP